MLSLCPSTEDATTVIWVHSIHSWDWYRCLKHWGFDISSGSAILKIFSILDCFAISHSLMADTIFDTQERESLHCCGKYQVWALGRKEGVTPSTKVLNWLSVIRFSVGVWYA